MTCRNCNNTLAGTEDFCPFCGTAQKEIEIKAIPCEEKSDAKAPPESSIFQSEPVYIYAEPPKEKKDTKTKVATVFVSVFLLTLLIVGGLSLAQYFNLTPAFSALLNTQPSQEESILPGNTAESEFDSGIGVLAPDINLKSTLCTVTSEKGLPLRKGPDNTYAQSDTLKFGTSVQVTGKSLQNDMWVYVYVPSLDLYGWISASYITRSAVIKEPDITETTVCESEAESE